MKHLISLFFSILVVTGLITSMAHSAPSPKSAAEFADYYIHGQGDDPVLAKIKLCGKVPRKGQKNAHRCIGDYTGFETNKNENLIIWMQFAAPQGDIINNLSLELSLNDKVIHRMPLSIEGSIRYRTYKAFVPNQSGLWQARVYISGEKGIKKKLGQMSIRVGQPLLVSKSQ